MRLLHLQLMEEGGFGCEKGSQSSFSPGNRRNLESLSALPSWQLVPGSTAGPDANFAKFPENKLIQLIAFSQSVLYLQQVIKVVPFVTFLLKLSFYVTADKAQNR